jgi:transposase
MGPNTERTYREAVQKAGMLDGPVEVLPPLEVLKDIVAEYVQSKPRVQHASSVEPWLPRIERMAEKGATPKAIYDRLKREDEQFTGSLSAIKRAYGRMRKAKGVSAEDVVIRVETDPGEVAQVDFGYVGKLFDPVQRVMRKAYVFVMVLAFSRHMFCEITFDQKQETWLKLHIDAFKWFGGVVRVVRPDNLKAAVIRAAFSVGEPTVLNRSYAELARHYGFKIDPAPAYSPEKKGKVESGVKYTKNNFFKTTDELDARVLNRELGEWVLQTAGTRIHGTTARQPLLVFEQEERSELLPLPQKRFEMVIWQGATVGRDSYVTFKKAFYSFPWRWIGKQVLVRATAQTVQIYGDNVRMATHQRALPGQRRTIEEHLPPYRRDLRHRNRQYWIRRANAIGEPVGCYINEVFDSDDVLDQMNVARKIVLYLEGFPRHRAIAACERARFYRNYKYQSIKEILRKALDQQSLFISCGF